MAPAVRGMAVIVVCVSPAVRGVAVIVVPVAVGRGRRFTARA